MATPPSRDRAPSYRNSARIGFAAVVRKILFGTLALAPLTILLHYVADLPETAEFVLAAIA